MKNLQKVQTELKAPKSNFNKFGNYAYRSCNDIVEAAKPILAKYGMVLTITDDIVEVGGRIYVKAIAAVTDGTESMTATAFAREPEQQKGMSESQITGAASSYARKYALNGLFAIDDTADADATNDHGKVEPADEVGDDKRQRLILMLEQTTYDEDMREKLASRIEAITTSEAYEKAMANVKMNMVSDSDRIKMGMNVSPTDVNKAAKQSVKNE